MTNNRIWPAAFYFLNFAALASISPFLAIYYQSLGFSGSQIGVILGIAPLITMFASPFLTGIADATHKHKHMLYANLVLVVAVMAVFPFLKSFWLILPAFLAFAFINAPIVALVDSATLSMLGGQRNRYGQIRLWGTVGWGIMGTVAGQVVERIDLQWIFWMYAGLMAFTLVAVRRLEFTEVKHDASFWTGMRSLLTNRRWVIFLLLVFITAFGFTAHTNFLGVLMESKGASRATIGFALTVTTLSEVPLLFFSAWLLKRIKAPILLLIAVAAGAVRCLVYAIAPSPEILLVVQLFHGLTFPLLWVAGVTFTAENAPPGLSATAQGLFGSVFMGIGSGVANVLSGWLIDLLGVAGMFSAIGFFVLAAVGILLLFGRRFLLSSA